MSATFLDPALAARARLAGRSTATTDLESTLDLQGEHTSDLAPATSDIEPATIVGTPELEHFDALEHVDALNSVDAVEHVDAIERAKAPAQPRPRLAATRPTMREPLAPGAVLCDRFILERVVGTGGTAVVYQARDMSESGGAATDTRVALKLPRPDRGDPVRASARLHHEFAQASKLSHPSIVRVRELHAYADSCFMTMELIQGRLLSTLVRDWTMLPRPLANKILRACAQALDHAHEHDVVHGDFKPGNVFLTRDENVKIVDFGASAALSGDSSRIPAGTPAYASPQVLEGETPDRRDDVFSFACVAYELLTGQHPFQHRSSLEARAAGAAPTRAWNLSASQWLGLLSALAWDREQRPADIVTLLESLLTGAEPIALAAPIQPSSDLVQTELPQELMPTQRGWGFFMFVACAIAVIFIAAQRQDGPDEPVLAATDETSSESAALPPLANSVVGAVERPRESLPSMSDDASFVAGDAKLASTSPALLSPAGATGVVAAPVRPRTPPAALSAISFESPTIVTTESSVAAVFVIKRSQPLRGRARVQWSASSGTAEAGIDFASNASGSVEFADGQAQRAIYVPLRNDLLKEEDETFVVKLQAMQNARVDAQAQSEATVRDDD